MDNLTKEQRKKNMQNIRAKDTRIERVLRQALWHKGFRYRKNYDKLPGKPDIVLTKYKIAIFCDGEFFHGKDWEETRPKILAGNNPDFWIPKIEKTMERDRAINEALMLLGWTVIRFWGKEILSSPDNCVAVIEETIMREKLQSFENEMDTV